MTFKALQNAFHAFVQHFESDALSFVSSLASNIVANGGKVLTDAAIAAVTAAETNGGTGQEKFAAAVASVTATLTAEGLPVVTNAVHGAIEAAVAQIKAENA